jgi:hypothetical protein
MKKLAWCLLSFFLCFNAYSQWTTSGNNIYNSNTGNVGIGTATPGTNLHINGWVAANTGLSVGATAFPSNAPTNCFTFTYESNLNGVLAVGSGAGFGIKFRTNSIDRLILTDGLTKLPNTPLLINQTTSNGNWLQVNGTTWTTGFILPTGAAAGKVLTSDASGNATWQTPTGGSSGWALNGNTDGAVKSIGTADNYDFPIITNSVERMRVTAGGSLAIGTTNPQGYLLAVNGSAIFTSATVKLNANWPDYVFKKGYRLPGLDSLSKYIAVNKHLPDLPSAETVAKTGIDLGTNQAALLKKIEELTLYLIDQDSATRAYKERFAEQDKTIQDYKRKFEDQERRLERLEKLMKP